MRLRYFPAVLALVLCFALTACDSSGTEEETFVDEIGGFWKVQGNPFELSGSSGGSFEYVLISDYSIVFMNEQSQVCGVSWQYGLEGTEGNELYLEYDNKDWISNDYAHETTLRAEMESGGLVLTEIPPNDANSDTELRGLSFSEANRDEVDTCGP